MQGTYNTWTLNISSSNKHIKQILFVSELYLIYADNDCINVTFLEYSYKSICRYLPCISNDVIRKKLPARKESSVLHSNNKSAVQHV